MNFFCKINFVKFLTFHLYCKLGVPLIQNFMFIGILYIKCSSLWVFSIVSVIQTRISPEAQFKALPGWIFNLQSFIRYKVPSRVIKSVKPIGQYAYWILIRFLMLFFFPLKELKFAEEQKKKVHYIKKLWLQFINSSQSARCLGTFIELSTLN